MNTAQGNWSQVGGILVPTLAPASWQNVEVVPGYRISFQLLSRCIVLSTPMGIASVASVNRVYELRNRFLLETIGEQSPFIEIRDFRHIPGLPESGARKRQVELHYLDALRCKGFIALNLNPMIQTMVRVGLFLMNSPFPYRIEKEIEDGVREALVLEQNLPNTIQENHSSRIHLDSWKCIDQDFCAEGFVIAPSIFLIRGSGTLRESGVQPLMELQESIMESGALDLTNYYRILDFSNMRGTEWSTRLRLVREMTSLFDRLGHPQFSYVCGANAWIRAVVWVFFSAFRGKLAFVVSEQDALLRIRNKDLFPIPKNTANSTNVVVPEDPEVRQLVQDIAQISWKSIDSPLPTVPASHRFYSVYEAIRLVALDIREVSDVSKLDQERIAQVQSSLDAASKMRTELLRVANHEIRTPLNGLVGILELLESYPHTVENQSYIATARRCTEDLQSILAKLLDFSSIEAGRFKLNSQPFVPHSIMSKLEYRHRPILQNRGISLHCIESGAMQCELLGDASRIEQILDIYLYNASKFTASGSVELRADAVLEGELVRVCFQVEDTGMGIRPEDLDKVFEPFGRGDYGFAKQFGSIGLGLTIAKQIAEVLGGKLSAKSEIGKGSNFTLELALPIAKR